MTNHHKRRKSIENWKNLKETDKYSIGEIKINQIDLKTNKVIKTWKSACEAGRQLGISSRNIITATKGKRKQAGGFAWEQIK